MDIWFKLIWVVNDGVILIVLIWYWFSVLMNLLILNIKFVLSIIIFFFNIKGWIKLCIDELNIYLKNVLFFIFLCILEFFILLILSI